MRVAIVSSLVALAASAAGIIITSPEKGEKVDFSKPVTIKWQSVPNDPAKFDIVLVNENVYPPKNEIVAAGVDADKGSYTIDAHDKGLTTTDNGGGYQVNILSPSGGILAQSQEFKLSGQKAESASSSVSTSTTTSSTSTMSTSTTTSKTKHMKTTETSTAGPTSTSNAAGLIVPPGQAGSLLLGLVALAL